jgi:DNA-binding MarR family transcriptional regulator
MTEQGRAAARDGLVDALAQAAFTVTGVLTRIAAEHELSLTQLRVLAILRGRRAGVTRLAQHLGLDKSTMTGLVARAEKRGLLERAPSASDKRAVEIFLSPTAVELAEKLTVELRSALAPLLEDLDDAERHRLRELLERMLAAQ